MAPISSIDDQQRRQFLATLLASSFALAVQPVAATVLSTPTDGLLAGPVTIPSNGTPLPAYRAQPAQASGPLPVVLVVHEIFGVHEHIQDLCRRLARVGYLAIAPELFVRQGDPRTEKDMGDILKNIVSKVADAQVLGDLDACANWAVSNGGSAAHMGITGFCWGGRITWLYAVHNPNLKAAVAWYGRLEGPNSELTPKQPLDLVQQLQVPVLGLYGAKDTGIPVDSVERMRTALQAVNKTSNIIIYPEAGHAFNADYRPSYHQASALDAWQRMLAWFKQYGV